MKNLDQMRRFLFEGNPIRGQHVSLDNSWQQIAAQSGAEGIALQLLGQALAAVSLLVETLKIDGSVTLQIRGDGPIHLLVAEATSRHTIRGIVRQSRAIDTEIELQDIFNTDKLVITIKTGGTSRHQGIVPLSGKNLSSALQAYFEQSEQLPTTVWFACSKLTVKGMLIQKMPGSTVDDDAWQRVSQLASTTQQDELLNLPAEQLLYRLFHGEDLRLFDTDQISFFCGCSNQRTRDMLISMGKTEIDDIIETQNEISITCEFCNAEYSFDRVDLVQLFSHSDIVPTGATRH